MLATKGAAVVRGDHFEVTIEVKRGQGVVRVSRQESHWEEYYRNIADHLLGGADLDVRPEEARCVIAILETAEKSSKARESLKVLCED